MFTATLFFMGKRAPTTHVSCHTSRYHVAATSCYTAGKATVSIARAATGAVTLGWCYAVRCCCDEGRPALTLMEEVKGSAMLNWLRIGENQHRRNSFSRSPLCSRKKKKKKRTKEQKNKKKKRTRGGQRQPSHVVRSIDRGHDNKHIPLYKCLHLRGVDFKRLAYFWHHSCVCCALFHTIVGAVWEGACSLPPGTTFFNLQQTHVYTLRTGITRCPGL